MPLNFRLQKCAVLKGGPFKRKEGKKKKERKNEAVLEKQMDFLRSGSSAAA